MVFLKTYNNPLRYIFKHAITKKIEVLVYICMTPVYYYSKLKLKKKAAFEGLFNDYTYTS